MQNILNLKKINNWKAPITKKLGFYWNAWAWNVIVEIIIIGNNPDFQIIQVYQEQILQVTFMEFYEDRRKTHM